MRFDPWRNWSIRSRLLAVIVIPVAYMFCTFVWYAWQSRQSEVRDELAERGPLVAKALADGSEFNLVSKRYEDLRLTINGLLKSDASIARIEVLDAQRRTLAQAAASAAAPAEPRSDNYSYEYSYEAPVLKRLIWVDMLAPDGSRLFSARPGDKAGVSPSEEKRSGATVETVGYVRVTMTPSALLRKQDKRFYVELMVASFGLLVCAVLAVQLSKGLNRSLQSAMQALREADAEKRRLIRKVNSAVEDERKSIALEIHDELNATLIAARLESQRIVDLAAQIDEGTARDEIRLRAQAVIKLTLGLYNSGRSLVRRLRPEVLDMLGLDGAVEEVVRHYDGAHTACRFEFSAQGDFSALDSALGISAYRIMQEALSNIVKHARATHVSVQLSLRPGRLHIAIADNGAGFDPAAASNGIGIVGMRERVYAFNGRIEIDTGLAAGTRIAITLPLA
jgi:two-component system sensor histidine kinase UhpB